jgi:hypothetical protein
LGAVHSEDGGRTCAIDEIRESSFKQKEADGILKCDSARDLKSRNSGIQVTNTFANSTQGTVSLFWLDYEGQPRPYGEIRPNEELAESTYAGHPWIFLDDKRQCIGVYLSSASNSRVVIHSP